MIVFVSTLAVTCYAAIVTGTNLMVEKTIIVFSLIFIEAGCEGTTGLLICDEKHKELNLFLTYLLFTLTLCWTVGSVPGTQVLDMGVISLLSWSLEANEG